jgi:DNA-binding SARP family transcriptional activator/TolB-like protein
MGRNVGATVEIRLLGPARVLRGGAEIPLPRSRKVRALLAYLATDPAPKSRSRLCDLLWDVPNDPRGELRWCLSKLRGVLDDDGRQRIVTSGQSTIVLDLADAVVDVVEIDRIAADGIDGVETERLSRALSAFAGDFLDGTEVDGAELTAWLAAQRQRYRSMHVAILGELTRRATPGSDEMFHLLEAWLQRAPFDRRAHEAMMAALIACDRHGDAEAHLSATIRAFEQEGLDWTALRDACHAARRMAIEPRVTAIDTAPPPPRPARHGSILVMPFREGSPASPNVAHGLTDDIITRLAKLRVLFVIARGTAYALSERGIDPPEAGRISNVEYVVSGTVRCHQERLSVVVELAETRDGGILWTEELTGTAKDTFTVLDSVVDRIVAAVADEIERAECKRALIKPPGSLDAWEAYHRGLWHMYRFTGPDNAIAARSFRDAIALDPAFARAHAGLSFTHFQNVFLDLTPDREHQMALALKTAGHSLAADDRDPAAHWAMGRALWLRGERNDSVVELERSVELSPNFALGHYTLGFVHAQSGDPNAGIAAADYSRSLSPFDPLQFGMLGSRALSHLRLGEREEAAEWAVKAARRPNAHVHILTIAAATSALARRGDRGKELVLRIRGQLPAYTMEDFLRAFRFDRDGESLFRAAAKQLGL